VTRGTNVKCGAAPGSLHAGDGARRNRSFRC
jgi:hypothetical protein